MNTQKVSILTKSPLQKHQADRDQLRAAHGAAEDGAAAGIVAEILGVKLMLETPMNPGVWGPEEYFSVAAFMEELRKRHFTVAEDIAVERAK